VRGSRTNQGGRRGADDDSRGEAGGGGGRGGRGWFGGDRRGDSGDGHGGEEGDGGFGGQDPLREAGRLGGDWAGTRPRFDDPMSWSVPMMRIFGIEVRIHVLFVIFVAIQLLRAAFAAPMRGDGPTLGPALVLLLMACLFWSVLLHEFGHCFACRATEGDADEILMWPLGGLAACRPDDRWASHLITAMGGPLVNVAILAVAAPTLGLLSGHWRGVALPSPFHLGGLSLVEESWGLTALYLLVWVNLALLLFNLLPLFPMDGGRILQAALWPRCGYADSMRYAVRAGYVGAIALAIVGLVKEETLLVMVALFGGIVCWQTMKRLEFTQQTLGFEPGPDGLLELSGGRPPQPDPEERRRAEAKRRTEEEAMLLDRILHKINESGLGSLSAKERRILREATERRRREGGEG
jgi:stage IV sporulation protein FB